MPGIFAYCQKCAADFNLPHGKVTFLGRLRFHLSSFYQKEQNTSFVCAECFYNKVFGVFSESEGELPFLNTSERVVK